MSFLNQGIARFRSASNPTNDYYCTRKLVIATGTTRTEGIQRNRDGYSVGPGVCVQSSLTISLSASNTMLQWFVSFELHRFLVLSRSVWKAFQWLIRSICSFVMRDKARTRKIGTWNCNLRSYLGNLNALLELREFLLDQCHTFCLPPRSQASHKPRRSTPNTRSAPPVPLDSSLKAAIPSNLERFNIASLKKAIFSSIVVQFISGRDGIDHLHTKPYGTRSACRCARLLLTRK